VHDRTTLSIGVENFREKVSTMLWQIGIIIHSIFNYLYNYKNCGSISWHAVRVCQVAWTCYVDRVRGFDLLPFHCQVTTMGNSRTRLLLTKQYNMVPAILYCLQSGSFYTVCERLYSNLRVLQK